MDKCFLRIPEPGYGKEVKMVQKSKVWEDV
jgi:hypothetical protein